MEGGRRGGGERRQRRRSRRRVGVQLGKASSCGKGLSDNSRHT